MGNLGTIMRTMVGFGKQDLVLIGPAADPYDPKVIRASMGAIFQLNINRFPGFENYRDCCPDHTCYPLMTQGRYSLPEMEFQPPYSLVFGEETSGLGEEYLEYGPSVRIPQHDAVDSLNLALSVGIALYHSWINE